jgi:hypothetical protein
MGAMVGAVVVDAKIVRMDAIMTVPIVIVQTTKGENVTNLVKIIATITALDARIAHVRFFINPYLIPATYPDS